MWMNEGEIVLIADRCAQGACADDACNAVWSSLLGTTCALAWLRTRLGCPEHVGAASSTDSQILMLWLLRQLCSAAG